MDMSCLLQEDSPGPMWCLPPYSAWEPSEGRHQSLQFHPVRGQMVIGAVGLWICIQLLGNEGNTMQKFAWDPGGTAAPDLCARTQQIRRLVELFVYESLV